MRVLWLTQSQLPAATGQASMVFGGWHEGLRSALEEHEPDIELGIVSLGAILHEPRRAGNATYYSLHYARGGGRARRAARTWWHSFMLPRGVVDEAAEIGRRFAPDLVHVHGTEHYLGLAALQVEAPAVATLQGIANVYDRFVLDGFTCPEVIRSIFTRDFLRGTGIVHGQISMHHRAQVESRIIGHLSSFIGQTDWDRDVLRLLKPSATYYHSECLMQQAFYEHVWRRPEGPEKTIYCTSGAAPYKGLEMMIEAVALLRKAGYRHVRLRIAGPIPDSNMWAPLARRASRSHVTDAITWLGPLGADGLVGELQTSDVYVLPSHIENQPNSLLEAMLLGVPCVAAAVGGVAELVEHGRSGLVFHDSDAFALAAAVARLLDDPDYACSMGEAARDQAHARYGREQVAHRTRQIYDDVISAASGQNGRPASGSMLPA
jgi:glycosyltransferase involved in cell wall biosynthesis